MSFVSVTQQFNTTSSMGRLTLNVLLSFAQFEREITGERIRDKIAASKAKGMWMGGNPPMGYVPRDRSLVIDEPAAQKVREIFHLYMTLGCIRKVKDEVDRRGWKTQIRVGQKSSKETGNRPFSRGHLYRILTSPLYTGHIPHKGKVYPGQHPAIIEPALWDAVQVKLSENRQGKRHRVGRRSPSLLAGLVWDDQGDRLTPSHSQKGERRYRYYISNRLLQKSSEETPDALRIPANELEGAVIQALREFLQQESTLYSLLEHRGMHEANKVQPILKRARFWAQMMEDTRATGSDPPASSHPSRLELLQTLVQRIVVGSNDVQISIRLSWLLNENKVPGQPEPPSTLATSNEEQDLHVLSVPIQLKRSGLAVRLMVQGEMRERGADVRLIQLVAKGHDWFGRLLSGKAKSLREIAQREAVDSNYVTRVIHLSFLAPDIITAIVEGRQPATVTADTIMHQFPLPIDWADQRKLLGFRS